MKKNHYGQGGFSDSVWNTKLLQEYLKSGWVCGYFSGNFFRKNVFDTIIEATLRAKGWSPFEISVWLTSSDARHFQDQVDKKTTLSDFYGLLLWGFQNYAKTDNIHE